MKNRDRSVTRPCSTSGGGGTLFGDRACCDTDGDAFSCPLPEREIAGTHALRTTGRGAMPPVIPLFSDRGERIRSTFSAVRYGVPP
ncbi:MAG: hypothetical protein OXF02_04680 [Simkaniaceae bacterium]|nr:hypothetical protein [Simkaniaceae bacterium]